MTGRQILAALLLLSLPVFHADAQIAYSTQVQPVFTANCSCHIGGPTSGVELTSYASVMASTGDQYGTKVIIPGNGTGSPLYNKISSSTPTFGARMPRGGAALSASTIATIKQWIDEGAKSAPTGVHQAATELPVSARLYQNFPNPFNPSTQLRFDLTERSRVRLSIYNELGQTMAVLADDTREAGTHSLTWNAAAPSGVYFCRLETSPVDRPDRRFTAVTKMLLMR